MSGCQKQAPCTESRKMSPLLGGGRSKTEHAPRAVPVLPPPPPLPDDTAGDVGGGGTKLAVHSVSARCVCVWGGGGVPVFAIRNENGESENGVLLRFDLNNTWDCPFYVRM